MSAERNSGGNTHDCTREDSYDVRMPLAFWQMVVEFLGDNTGDEWPKWRALILCNVSAEARHGK